MSQITNWLDKENNRYGYYNPNNYFTNRALPWLLQQKIDKKSYYNLLTKYNGLILLDTKTIVDMIAADLKEKDNYRSFGQLDIHRRLTIKQLDSLKSSWGVQIADTNAFLGCYIKKLAPLSIQVMYIFIQQNHVVLLLNEYVAKLIIIIIIYIYSDMRIKNGMIFLWIYVNHI